MKILYSLCLISYLLLASASILAQDATLTQWQNLSSYFNPSLTGDFDGQLRFSVQYRNSQSSILGSSAYKTSAMSTEYRFKSEQLHKFNLGFLALRDRAGSADLTNSVYNINTSVIRYLGDPEQAHHQIRSGLSLGMGARSINLSNLQFADTTEVFSYNSATYINISSGINWKYTSNAKFIYHLGIALHNLNRPNASLYNNGTSRLDRRLNIHGGMDLPVTSKASILPSFLYFKQGPFEQLLFGLAAKCYLDHAKTKHAQLGFYAKTVENIDGSSLGTYSISTSFEIKGLLLGFSIDRFRRLRSNAYEFSLGYTLFRRDT